MPRTVNGKTVFGTRIPKCKSDSKVKSWSEQRPDFVIRELTREERLRIGVAGAHGWRGFCWGRSTFGPMLGIAPGDCENNYSVVPIVTDEQGDCELIAAIYLASIGERLD